jgi:hypothetical protein
LSGSVSDNGNQSGDIFLNQTSILSKLASIKVDDDAILVIALCIFLSAALMGTYWYRRGLGPLRAALRGLTAELKGVKSLESRQAHRLPEGLNSSFPGLNEVWHETVARIVWLPVAQGQQPVLLSSPRDLWTPARLLAGRINLGLAEAMPNLLVGIGLLCTFFFLTLALAGATSALVGQGGEPKELVDATRELLRTAGGKFVTSLAGLGASVLWTVLAKRQAASLDGRIDEVLSELNRLAPFNGGERALAAQFAQFGAMRDKLVEQHATTLTGVEVAKAQQVTATSMAETGVAHKALAEELVETVTELRAVTEEQAAAFKSFSTDLAVSLGTAIDKALAPRFEAMTGQLVASLDKLTERIGTINQESLDRMAHEHAKRLAEATKEEMDEFKVALVDLAGRLTSAGGAINASAGEAAKSLGDAGQALKSQMDETGAAFSTQLATAAQALNDAAGGTAGQLDTAGKQLAQGMTAAGAEITAAAQGAAEALRGGIETAANRLQQAGQNAAASIDIAGTTLKLQSENMATTMAAQVDQCAQALARASGGVEAAMGVVMRQLGEAATQASQRWAGGVSSAVDLLTAGARQASDVLGKSTFEASKAFDVSAAELARQAGLFGQVMSDKLSEVAIATSTMNREVQGIAKAAQELAAQGIDGANRFNAAMERTGLVVNTLGELAGTWEPLVASLRGAAQEVRAATHPMGDMVKSLNALGADLMTRSPQALAAIQQVTHLLSQAAQQTRDAMDGSRRALDDTSKTLHKTVAEMREGVGAYSGQVAALHLQLDAALAKAISGINGSVNNMSGAIEALNDSFGRLPLRA